MKLQVLYDYLSFKATLENPQKFIQLGFLTDTKTKENLLEYLKLSHLVRILDKATSKADIMELVKRVFENHPLK